MCDLAGEEGTEREKRKSEGEFQRSQERKRKRDQTVGATCHPCKGLKVVKNLHL